MDVSILIPVKNRADLTRVCLEALWDTLPEPGEAGGGLQVEVLVFDDGSTDETPALLAEQARQRPERFRVLTKPPGEPGGFARNNNTMARAARGSYLVLLNNDTVPLLGWLEPMLALLKQHDDVAVVGNVQVFPGPAGARAINHAGIVFDADARPSHLYEGLPETLAAAGQTREFQAVTAACWAVPRSAWDTLNGLDEGYRNGHEDIDFCLRARAAGMRVLIAGDSRIVHHGVSTPGRLAHDQANTQRYLQRHRDSVQADLERIPAEDGVAWPVRTLAYRVARTVWRTPVIRSIAGLALRSRLGLVLRQRVLRRLVRSR